MFPFRKPKPLIPPPAYTALGREQDFFCTGCGSTKAHTTQAFKDIASCDNCGALFINWQNAAYTIAAPLKRQGETAARTH
jgi:hypothetical protein